MTRRLLGYVVKLPDGTRSPRTPKPIKLYLAARAWDGSPADAGDYVVPVFARRTPTAEPPVAEEPHRDVPVWSRHVPLRHPRPGDEGKLVVFTQGATCTRIERLTRVDVAMCELGLVYMGRRGHAESFETARCFVIAAPDEELARERAAGWQEGVREATLLVQAALASEAKNADGVLETCDGSMGALAARNAWRDACGLVSRIAAGLSWKGPSR